MVVNVGTQKNRGFCFSEKKLYVNHVMSEIDNAAQPHMKRMPRAALVIMVAIA